MLLADNFIHPDMHPGNILLRISKGSPSEEPPTLVLIDDGMVDVMSETELENFIGLFKSMGSGEIFFCLNSFLIYFVFFFENFIVPFKADGLRRYLCTRPAYADVC